VFTSLALLLLVIYVPFLSDVFDTTRLTLMHWATVIPLIALPSIVAELTKIYLRRLHAHDWLKYAIK
jgi:hypothetical protein